MEAHQFRRNGPLAPAQYGPYVTSNEPNATQDKRLLPHLKQASEALPDRMPADQISLAAIMKAHAELPMRTRADAKFAVMEAHFLREGARSPAFHAGGGGGDPINCADFYRDVAADFFKAFFAKHLAGARNVG